MLGALALPSATTMATGSSAVNGGETPAPEQWSAVLGQTSQEQAPASASTAPQLTSTLSGSDAMPRQPSQASTPTLSPPAAISQDKDQTSPADSASSATAAASDTHDKRRAGGNTTLLAASMTVLTPKWNGESGASTALLLRHRSVSGQVMRGAPAPTGTPASGAGSAHRPQSPSTATTSVSAGRHGLSERQVDPNEIVSSQKEVDRGIQGLPGAAGQATATTSASADGQRSLSRKTTGDSSSKELAAGPALSDMRFPQSSDAGRPAAASAHQSSAVRTGERSDAGRPADRRKTSALPEAGARSIAQSAARNEAKPATAASGGFMASSTNQLQASTNTSAVSPVSNIAAVSDGPPGQGGLLTSNAAAQSAADGNCRR